jgi:hypothetical protein
MPQNARRRNTLIVVAIVILALLLLLLTRCRGPKPAPPQATGTPPAAMPAPAQPQAEVEPAPQAEEILTPATLTVPAQIAAGATFSMTWTGPDNPGDYITLARPDAPADATGNYQLTERGETLELTAPMEPGAYEARYIASRSRTILGRTPVEVLPIAAALEAPDEIILGATFSVSWTGPNNTGDYITVVPKGAPDDRYENYVDTAKGSPLTLTAPPEAGDAELRYVSGQGRKVLARRPIKVVMPEITLSAPADAIAGTMIEVAWMGPDNAGDYITIVAADIPDGPYGNYTNTSTGSPLKLLMPIMSGPAEIRYMTGQGRQVLARRTITIVAAAVSLSAAPEAAPGADVAITWTGPNNPSDYITIVPRELPDGQYRDYATTSNGSPLTVKAPKDPGDAEVRYMSGQGGKVLARIPIRIVP